MSTKLAEKPLAAAEDIASLKATFTVGQYGVWRVLTANSPHALKGLWDATLTGLRLLCIFMTDVWHVDPALCLILFTAQLWNGMQTSITLYTSNRLLTSVSSCTANPCAFHVDE